MNTRLRVWWERSLVGDIILDGNGDVTFTYDHAWMHDPAAPAISHSLPKRAALYTRHELRPFFSGLLPEGDPRRLIARRLGVSEKNDYALLDALGGDVAGVLTLLPPDEQPTARPRDDATIYNDEALLDIIRRLPHESFYDVGEGIRFSLAGAQSKLPVKLVGGRVALPAPGEATTHILKPTLPRFPGNVANEAFCLRLARMIGLDAAACMPRSISGEPYLLIERYDRMQEADGAVRRLHQEDFCQALGIVPERKYQAEGGPNLRDCRSLLATVGTRPAQEILAFLNATIFNVIIGNADAHGKNFSLLYHQQRCRLAPLYDLLSTVMYPQISMHFAMSIGKTVTLEQMNAKSLDIWAEQLALKPALLRRRIREIAAAITQAAEPLRIELGAAGLDHVVLEALQQTVIQRARHLAAIATP